MPRPLIVQLFPNAGLIIQTNARAFIDGHDWVYSSGPPGLWATPRTGRSSPCPSDGTRFSASAIYNSSIAIVARRFLPA